MKTPAYFSRPLATVAPRDLLLLEHLHPRPSDVALEIGVGSGSTLFRLARHVKAFHSLDISAETVERVRRAVAARPAGLEHTQLLVADFCAPDAPAALPTHYDLIFSCDTLEHVAQPGAFLANVYRALNPGGRLFLAYPNEYPDRAHGITFFERLSTLTDLLRRAGFPPEQTGVDTFRLTPGARRWLDLGWRLPRRFGKKVLRLVRRLRRSAAPAENPNGLPPPSEAPQTFDRTDFFAAAHRLEPFAPVINAYCWAVMKLMSRAAPVYEILPAPEVLWDTEVLIRATRV